jgi:hypothetical protein
LSEPPGFITWWSIDAEFRGAFEFTPRALRARMGAGLTEFQRRRNFTIASDQAQIFRINDNGGNDFEFRKLNGQHVWIVDEAFQVALSDLPQSEQETVTAPRYDNQEAPLTRALTAVAATDILAAGISTTQTGLSLNPAVPEARAAWYSFGFLVRRAAAVRLDVSESELDLGIQPVLDPLSPFAPPSARIFLSDSLENGAGYSTFLGDPDRFEELLRFIVGDATEGDDEFYDPLVETLHESSCASSCHRCLREFGNMAYHALLDWRLGLDMVRLALDPLAQVDLEFGYWASVVSRTAPGYFTELNLVSETFGGLNVGVSDVTNEAFILIHPLWDRSYANLRADVATAVAEAERRGLNPVLRSLFRAIRFPYE